MQFTTPPPRTPQGLEDVSRYPWLLAELLRDPRWTVADIRKLIGENVRDDMQAKGVEPLEEEIHPEYLKGKTNCTYIFD
ncbi:Dipeptidase 1-like 4 [Homarus americanus]|uniref:Dipeptidase 1-like 4 n=1 Tax=Homarus americanus TaxID=6706 RepID=A0A8J5MZ82_HOMAM|nr:Dipeptidase 1-like 4 [Homarus americanus]